MDKHRVCYECEHLTCGYERDYSMETPGNGLELQCLKGHWDLNSSSLLVSRNHDDLSPRSLRAALETARTCADFEPTDS